MIRKLKIYNTLTKEKELFKPIVKNHVGIYVCGPTVYGDPHLGHARPAIVFDIIFRYFTHIGFKIRYVRNITDVGHLENDADDGEDKISKKAKSAKLEPMEVAQFYTEKYHDSLRKLNCLSPSVEPRATGHIIEQIEMIEKIIDNGFAYVVSGSVYMNVKKYGEKYNYGVLSGRKIEDNIDRTRELESQSEKKHPADFALWKKASNRHIMKWNSPWGLGFPGWHIECSAMSKKYLGKHFDIHGGGIDLLFPHHEAEICQSYAADLCRPANYWVHNNLITIEGQKMGKSLNNFINLHEFFSGKHVKLERSYHPMTIRFFILQAHYRGTIDFSNKALQASEKGLAKLMKAMNILNSLTPSKKSTYNVSDLEDKCYAAMDDDFNTPILIAHLFDGVKIINSTKDGKASLCSSDLKKLKTLFDSFVTDLLGLVSEKNNSRSEMTNEVMMLILKLRENAKSSKDFATADLIRDELNKLKVQINDGRDGSSWKFND
jgi:cysteinyl-tRNA synthetase